MEALSFVQKQSCILLLAMGTGLSPHWAVETPMMELSLLGQSSLNMTGCVWSEGAP